MRSGVTDPDGGAGEPVPPGTVGPPGEEEVQELVRDGKLRIERIVSRGHASPPGFWYDQPEHEWVMVLGGRAVLEVVESEGAAEGEGAGEGAGGGAGGGAGVAGVVPGGVGEGETIRRVEMGAGDHLVLPAHRRHRVAWTDPDEETTWLAVFWT
jgi:cupin 2 domain-containing protein